MTNKELIKIAVEARQHATPVISKYKVGAALLCKNGNVYTGCNIEDSACLRLGVCAERLAFFKAIEAGETQFTKIAVVGGLDENNRLSTLPCGICRQFMAIYAPDIDVIFLDDNGKILKTNIKELLPSKYNENFVKEDGNGQI